MLTKMLGDLKDESWGSSGYFETIENRWKVLVELDVDDGSNNGNNASLGVGRGGLSGNLQKIRK